MTMNVLIGCEFSGIVRDAFLKRGHFAMSCDFLPSESPEGLHYRGNVLDVLNPEFLLNNGKIKWDLIIMHPGCTALCNAGNKHYAEGSPLYYERVAAARWTAILWSKCRHVCKNVVFENPPGVLTSMAGLPLPQFVQPYEFGHMQQKRTGLYKTASVPDLVQTNNVYREMMRLPVREREAVFYMGPSADRWKDRARTFTGIGDAFAEQWGNL